MAGGIVCRQRTGGDAYSPSKASNSINPPFPYSSPLGQQRLNDLIDQLAI
jgi:hypothetical protein